MLVRQARHPYWVRAVLLGAILIGESVGPALAAGPVAVGRVTDLQGHAVAGVLVKPDSPVALGPSRSDAQGRFEMPLSQPVKELSLTVEHPGFQRWSLYGASPDRDGFYQIRLTRNIDHVYLTELAAQSDPARFRELARDLLAPSMGTVGDELPMAQVLPFLKALRERLRALLPADPAQLRRANPPEEQDKAALLLAYLGDPRDDALVDAWAAKQNYVSRPQRRCAGPTADAAARAWTTLHFKREGYRDPKKVPYNTLITQVAPSGDHGLALHKVFYAYWGYSQYLVLVRLKDAWEVRRVIEEERWHNRY